jgi:hypothetical protein
VSCASPELCIAVDANSQLVTATRPGAYPTAWKIVAREEPGGPTAVSCASIAFCVATTYDGDVMVSKRPTVKGSWTLTHVDATALSDISCPSVSLCVAVDLAGNAVTSTRPASGPSSWKLTLLDRNPVDPAYNPLHVACPSVRLCIAVGLSGHAEVATPRRRG